MPFGWDIIGKIILSAIVAMIAAEWIFSYVLRIAKRLNITDRPNARKHQKEPTPVMGGLVVYFGMLVGLTLAICLLPESGVVLPVVVCCGILLLIGFVDDILDISPFLRLFIEVLTMLALIYSTGLCVDSLHGLWSIWEFSWWIGVPLTVFAGVGIINAFNMADGVNGLSSGLCFSCCALLGVIFYKSADPINAALAAAFAGALIPFFIHNVFCSKSRMFIGDSGTMMMGLLVSWLVIRCMNTEGLSTMKEQEGITMNMAAMLLAVVSVPVVDALRVMTQRLIHRQSPFRPDRIHLHHAFLQVGASHLVTTLSEIFINMTVTAIWYTSYKMGMGIDAQMYITIAAAAILVIGSYLLLRHIEKHKHPSTKLTEI